jgi:hypothetical protein
MLDVMGDARLRQEQTEQKAIAQDGHRGDVIEDALDR